MTESTLLTIGVPTWNREKYLGELLPELVKQVNEVEERLRGRVDVLVSDNASTDGTRALVEGVVKQCASLRYRRNASNLGFVGNYRALVAEARGRYFWALGDDDVLETKAVERVLALVEREQPALTVALDALRIVGQEPDRLRAKLGPVRRYRNYASFLSRCRGSLSGLAMAHTWIPSVVYRRDLFDLEEYDRRSTDYGASYGLMAGLRGGGLVLLACEPIVKLRAARAPHEYKGIPEKGAVYLMTLGWHYKQPRFVARGAGNLARILAGSSFRSARHCVQEIRERFRVGAR